MRYHAYTEYRESVYDWTGEAASPQEAAILAATGNHIAGTWTVLKIAADPVEVKIREKTFYETE